MKRLNEKAAAQQYIEKLAAGKYRCCYQFADSEGDSHDSKEQQATQTMKTFLDSELFAQFAQI